MRNHWVSGKEPLAVWAAYLSNIRHDPKSLLNWLHAVLSAGEEFAIYTVKKNLSIEYQRDRDGLLFDHLDKTFEVKGVVNLFHFTYGHNCRPFARIEYFDQQEQLREGDIDDLGLLLRKLRSADFETAGALMSSCSPLYIWGPLIDFRVPKNSDWNYLSENIKVEFSICSDIWFPWVRGFLEDIYDPNRMYDNRMLAERHTPRLNRFLRLVEEATLLHGGKWELDQEQSPRELRFMLGNQGICLDVESSRCTYYE